MPKKTHIIKPRKPRKTQPINPALHRRDKYAGIDFAEDWHDFAVIDQYGNWVDGYQVKNNREGIDDLIANLRSHATGAFPIPVAIEGNADLIVQELHAAGFPLVLIPPYSVKVASTKVVCDGPR